MPVPFGLMRRTESHTTLGPMTGGAGGVLRKRGVPCPRSTPKRYNPPTACVAATEPAIRPEKTMRLLVLQVIHLMGDHVKAGILCACVGGEEVAGRIGNDRRHGAAFQRFDPQPGGIAAGRSPPARVRGPRL